VSPVPENGVRTPLLPSCIGSSKMTDDPDVSQTATNAGRRPGARHAPISWLSTPRTGPKRHLERENMTRSAVDPPANDGLRAIMMWKLPSCALPEEAALEQIDGFGRTRWIIPTGAGGSRTGRSAAFR